MEQTVLPEIVNIISQKTGVSPADTARVLNYYIKVLNDSARRLTCTSEARNTSEKKYPRQLEAIRRPAATLSFDVFYAEPNEDADSYLETPAYDRIKVTLVDVSDKTRKLHPEANIHADDWHIINMRSKRAFFNTGNAAPEGTTAKPAAAVSTAYTLRFTGGALNNYTPAAVLLKKPAMLTDLKAMCANMKQDEKNLPLNQAYITAISEAIALFEAGQLDRQATIDGMADKPAKNPENTDAAYTRKFNMGEFKGKSPAAVLLEDPNNAAKLKSQRDFLAKNAEKYPANKQLMEAIDIALALSASGKLSKEAASKTASESNSSDEGGTIIYDSSWRAPRSHEKDNEGLSKVYRVLITHDAISRPKYPWRIAISNGRSVCKKAENGRLSIGEIRKDETFITRYLNISDDEWLTVLRKIELSYGHFYGNMFGNQYSQACEYTETKRRAAIAAKTGS